MSRPRQGRSLLLPCVALLLFFWAVSLDAVTVLPLVGEDEPWIAAAPYKLATQGIYGSDLFAGYYGMEQHHYQHPPVYPLLQALVFKGAGAGVFQMRFLSVSFGLVVLALTFVVGTQIAGGRVGILAVVLLLLVRFAPGGEATGIPLLDLARVNRYDIAVPAFGLAAFWVFNRAEGSTASARLYLLSGALVGMAGLSHIYGLFWLPALGLVLLIRRRRRLLHEPAPYLLTAGVGLVWLPWLAYVVGNWSDFLGQQRLVADRLDLLNPAFYLENLRHEVDRYRLIDLFDERGRLRIARPGMWLTILGLPIATTAVLWHGRKRVSEPHAALAVALVVQAGLFALVLKQKHYNYMIALWPIAMLALAWLGVRLRDHVRVGALRVVLVGVMVLVLAEGGIRIAHRHSVAEHTTPYSEYTARVAAYIPESAEVLGLQHYWLGLRQYSYRSWILAVLFDGFYHEELTLDEAMDRIDPNVVLVDRHMGGFFERAADPNSLFHENYLQFRTFMERHDAVLVGVVEDSDYGRMEVYWLEQPAATRKH